MQNLRFSPFSRGARLQSGGLLFCFLVFAFTTPAQAQDLLRVNHQTITLEEVEAVNAAAANDQAVRQQVTEQLAQQILLAGTVHTVPAELNQRIDAAQINVKRQNLAQFAADSYLQANPITETQIEAQYQKLMATQPKTQYWVRWIVVKTPDAAKSVLDALKNGKQDFAEVAVAQSIGQNAELGGALGWQTEQSLPAAVLAVVRKLQTGQVAGPIALDSGYAIVQLVAQRAAPQPTLEQLRPQIVLQLRNAALQHYVQTLAKSATIENLMQRAPQQGAAAANQDANHAKP